MSIETRIFCENLKKLRAKEGLSKKKMAEKLKISIYFISILEKGKIPPKLDIRILFTIAKCYGTTCGEIFSKDFVK